MTSRESRKASRAHRRAVALTGTPGTGKSRVAGLLPEAWSPVEVGEWAGRAGHARRLRGSWIVDLAALQRDFARLHRAFPHPVYVGHLAHLLPIRDVIVLRCHPRELARRLARARRGTPRQQTANVVAEALDLILVESLTLGRRVWEVDTTGRDPRDVARIVVRLLSHRGPPKVGRIRWLEDPTVTDYLLEQAP